MATTAAPPPPPPARVLIIGAGYAGAVCAAALAAACERDLAKTAASAASAASAALAPPPAPPPLLETTLVDPRDHLDSAFTHARGLVEPSIAPRALLPFASMSALRGVRRVRASVVALTPSEARLSDGASQPFDYCVVAAGSSYAFGKSAPSGPATGMAARLDEINRASELFLGDQPGAAPPPPTALPPPPRCRRVLVVGGGPLGVEVAAELLTDAPRVERVTLVQSSDRLLPALPRRAGRLAQSWLAGSARGAGRCRVVLGRRVAAGDPLLLAAEAAMRGEPLPAAAKAAGLTVVGGVVVAPEGGAVAALERRAAGAAAGAAAADGAAAAAASGGGDVGQQSGEDDETVAYDAAIVATGILRNTGFLRGGPFAGALAGGGGEEQGAGDKKEASPPGLSPAGAQAGAVRVDASLRVAGFSNVFAAGDCTDVPEEKLAFLASSHGELVADNVLALARARRAEALAAAAAVAAAEADPSAAAARPPAPPAKPPVLRVWKPSLGMPVAIVTLGRAYAIMCVGPVAAAGWLPTKLKASNLLGFVDKYRVRLGVAEGAV